MTVNVNDEPLQADGAQVAGLVGEKWLLAARVGRRHASYVRRRVPVVHPVQEDHSRLAVAPRAIDDLLEDLARVQPSHLDDGRRGVRRVLMEPERVGGARLHGLHELMARAHRDVEVVDFTLLRLAVDEFQDVGMVNVHDGHVRAVPSCRPA